MHSQIPIVLELLSVTAISELLDRSIRAFVVDLGKIWLRYCVG